MNYMQNALLMSYYACYSSFEKNKHCSDADFRHKSWYINPSEMETHFSGESLNGMLEWSVAK